MGRRRLAVLRQDAELRTVDMERMQHHIAHPGDDPAFILTFAGRENRLVHIERHAVYLIRVMEIKLTAVQK